MYNYVYYTIIIFFSIIFVLYVYIFLRKTLEIISNKKKENYAKYIMPYLDELIIQIDDKPVNEEELSFLKNEIKHTIKREIIKDNILYYFENFKGSIIERLSKFCEDINLIEYEIKNLKCKDIHKIALSCKHLGEYRNDKAIDSLLKLVDNYSYDVKYNALLAISKIGNKEAFLRGFNKLKGAVPLDERSLIEIIDSFEGDKNYVYKKMINSNNDYLASVFIKSAGNHMDSFVSEEISKHIFDENKEKRIAAIKALGAMADTRYIDSIIKSLEDMDWEVRAISAKMLGRFENEKALYPLIKTLSDNQWNVRYNAAISILSTPNGLEVIKEILNGKDKFAKDIIIASIENSNVFYNKIYLYENSDDINKREIAFNIKNYLSDK